MADASSVWEKYLAPKRLSGFSAVLIPAFTERAKESRVLIAAVKFGFPTHKQPAASANLAPWPRIVWDLWTWLHGSLMLFAVLRQ
jgi:hypothetical protein